MTERLDIVIQILNISFNRACILTKLINNPGATEYKGNLNNSREEKNNDKLQHL